MNDDKLVARALFECSLFNALKSDELAILQRIATQQTVPAGAPIFMLGEEATTLYVVASGCVALMLPLAIQGQAAEITIEEKHPGQVIAWSTLVAPHKLTLSARAKEETTLIAIRRDDLRVVLKEHPGIRMTTMDNLCRVIASRVALLEALLMRDLQRRVGEVSA